MSRPEHEDRVMHAFMVAPLAEQARRLTDWGESPAGLLILMSGCEGQCFFCAQPVVTNPPASMITPWDGVASKLETNQALGLKTLMLGGTEPPTHPYFERTLIQAMSNGFESIQLMTSGLKLASKGQEWWALGVRSVCTPLYGRSAAAHDAIVGVVGHFDRVVEGLDRAVSLGINVFVHTLAMRRTLEEVPAMGAWVRERWGRPLALAPMRPKEELYAYALESPPFDAIREVLTEDVALVGFPRCVGPSGDAALLTRLYFKSQRRDFAPPCMDCAVRADCEGVVVGHLAHFGSRGLSPS